MKELKQYINKMKAHLTTLKDKLDSYYNNQTHLVDIFKFLATELNAITLRFSNGNLFQKIF